MFRLAAELESHAAGLRLEVLQHLTIALAGVDCKDLWRVLVTFFGTCQEEDLFQYLDAAPIIKCPLDLTDTESEEEEGSLISEAASATLKTSTSSQTTSVAKKPVLVKPRNIT